MSDPTFHGLLGRQATRVIMILVAADHDAGSGSDHSTWAVG